MKYSVVAYGEFGADSYRKIVIQSGLTLGEANFLYDSIKKLGSLSIFKGVLLEIQIDI